MLEVLANYVFFPKGVFALFALLFIIIFFFLKKKTTITRLPTMMFLLKEQGKKKYKWFPRIPFNLLLLLYLLIALLIAAAIMEPFYQTNASNTQKHVIQVIDNSASMQTADRFELAIVDAKKQTGTYTTIITTSPKPTVLLEKGSYLQARTTLSHIELTDATSPLKETIQFLQSKNYDEGALHIYSDFLDNTLASDEIEQLLNALPSLIIVPHIYNNGQNTIGFIDAKITKEKLTLLIRNFKDEPITAVVTIDETETEVFLQGNDLAPITISLPEKPTTITLSPTDELMSDNTYYISAPTKAEKKLLYITQNPYAYTESMLDVLDFITYDTYSPPGAVNSEEYDAFIIEDIDPTKLLPSNVNGALEKVSQGGVLIIKMGNKLRKMEPRDEFPFSEILPKKRAQIAFTSNRMTESLTAASEEEIFPITKTANTTVLVETATGDVVVAYKKYGQGGILYYGITDRASGAQFKQTYAYPILFQRIFKQNFHIPSVLEQQKETGEQWIGAGNVLDPDNKPIELPLTLSKKGFYKYQGSQYGVNLLSLTESQTKVTDDIQFIKRSSTDEKTNASLLIPLIVAILLFILLEILFLKKRGEH